MEKGTIILSIGFIMIVGLYALNMTVVDINADETSISYADGRQARQISLSGVALATNNLRYNPSWAGGYAGRDLMGGTLTVTIDSTGLPSGQRRVTSIGQYAGVNDSTEAIIQLAQPVSSFNLSVLGHQSAIEMKGGSFKLAYGTLFKVKGGSSYGIATNSTDLRSSIWNALTAKNVQDSVEGQPYRIWYVTTMDRDAQAAEVLNAASIVYKSGSLGKSMAWGTMASPQIVYVTRSLTISKPLNGAGILCIDGDLTVKDDLHWDGYVIVTGKSFNVKSGANVTIDGTVYFGTSGGTLQFGSYGTMRITYDTSILDNLDAYFASHFNTLGKPSVVRLFD